MPTAGHRRHRPPVGCPGCGPGSSSSCSCSCSMSHTCIPQRTRIWGSARASGCMHKRTCSCTPPSARRPLAQQRGCTRSKLCSWHCFKQFLNFVSRLCRAGSAGGGSHGAAAEADPAHGGPVSRHADTCRPSPGCAPSCTGARPGVHALQAKSAQRVGQSRPEAGNAMSAPA